MAVRADWIDKREAQAASANGNRNMSQMHFARQGIITEEMEYIAKREHLEPELIRSTNEKHKQHPQMAIAICRRCILRGRASSPKRWSTSPSASTSSLS